MLQHKTGYHSIKKCGALIIGFVNKDYVKFIVCSFARLSLLSQVHFTISPFKESTSQCMD